MKKLIIFNILLATQLCLYNWHCNNSENEIFWRKKNIISENVVRIITDYITCCAVDKICILYCTSFDGYNAKFRLFGLANTNANLVIPQNKFKIQPTGFLKIQGHIVFVYTHFDVLLQNTDNSIWDRSRIFIDNNIINNWDEKNQVFLDDFFDVTSSDTQWELIVYKNTINVNKNVSLLPVFPNIDTAKIDSPIRFTPSGN